MLAAGCGTSPGQITGAVRYKGKSLSGGIVTFLPASGQGAFNAPIQSDGNYTLYKVPVGKGTITVKSAADASSSLNPMMQKMVQDIKSGKTQLSPEAREKMPPNVKKALESPSPKAFVSIPASYGDPEKSGLELEATGGKQTHDIELK
ncbi:MAG TPA: hypothetical protein VH682_03180 [Gemmataceae bacterium]|jgi:hypothetical protein